MWNGKKTEEKYSESRGIYLLKQEKLWNRDDKEIDFFIISVYGEFTLLI